MTGCTSTLQPAYVEALHAAGDVPTNEGVENASPLGADRLVRRFECIVIVIRRWLALHAPRSTISIACGVIERHFTRLPRRMHDLQTLEGIDGSGTSEREERRRSDGWRRTAGSEARRFAGRRC